MQRRFRIKALGFVFMSVIGLAVCLALLLFMDRERPVVHRSSNLIFIQNPFRDRSKEAVAEGFFKTNVGKTVAVMSTENPDIVFHKREGEEQHGKLVDWSLVDRQDLEMESVLTYYVYREAVDHKPKRGRYLLSFVNLIVKRDNDGIRLSKYDCTGVSWNDW